MNKYNHTDDTKKIFNSIIREYRNITSDSDLDKIELSYEDYKSNSLGLVLDSLRFYGQSQTHSESVALWLKKHGCTAIEENGIWKIKLG